MTQRADPGRATDRPKPAGAGAKPICRRLLTIAQGADFVGVPVQVICRWIMIRKLEAYHLGGGRIRIDEVELAGCISSPESKSPWPSGRAD